MAWDLPRGPGPRSPQGRHPRPPATTPELPFTMRAIWSGSIGFGLVNIPVKLFSAAQDSGLDFDMLDRKGHGRIRYKRVNEDTGKEVPWEQIVKGYMLNDEYVILEDDDFEEASPKRTKIIEIETFVEGAQIDPIYYENPYFVQPDKNGAKPYKLLFTALQKTKRVGLCRFIMRSKEQLAVVRPRDNHLVVQGLRFEQELRSAKELDLPTQVKLSPKELDMALKLVKQYSAPFDLSKFKDEYSKELLRIIKAKAAGKRKPIKKLRVVRTKDEDLLERLEASLGSGTPKKRAS